ncbi:MAG TPA: hypothetical protein VGB46_10980 [Flavisolibacter sp.]|jgi:hypothetical protein
MRYLALLLLQLPLTAKTQNTDPVVVQELKFAAEAQVFGLKKAFLYNSDTSATGMSGKQFTRFYQVWERMPERPGFNLFWYPKTAYISADGKYAVTSGPSFFTTPRDSQITQTGHYFSIWKKDAQRFRIIFDAAVDYAGGALPIEKGPSTVHAPFFAPPDRQLKEDARKIIRQAHEAWKKDMEKLPLHAAFRRAADSSSIFLLPGQEQLSGSRLGPVSFLSSPARSDSSVLHFSADGRFCYEYGRLQLLPTSAGKYVNYVHVWIISRRKAILAFAFLSPF